MLLNIKALHGNKLRAKDGEIGHIKDFYFSDQTWIVRYFVADTGSWFHGEQVLISPYACGSLYQPGKLLLVNLTRRQIEGSPPMELHQPVSRQYEEKYHGYYAWPPYWEGEGSSELQLSHSVEARDDEASSTRGTDHLDAHLFSAWTVIGYRVQTREGVMGHVSDLIIDTETWAIKQLRVHFGHVFSPREVEIPIHTVDRISQEEDSVFVDLTSEEVTESPVCNPKMAQTIA